MTDGEERLRLAKLYSEMADEELLEILSQDEAEYRRNPYAAYELVINEAQRRGIYGKVEERQRAAAELERQHAADVDAVIVYTGTPAEAGLAQNILATNGIEAFLRDEAMGTMAAPYVSPVSRAAVKVVVDKKYSQQAKALLAEYLS